MKRFVIVMLLMFCPSVFAQKTFEINDASTFFDIKVSVAKCEDTACTGKASFSFYKKGGNTPYQVIRLADTYVELDPSGNPNVNSTLLYDKQSSVNIGDFNFDGMEDVTLCDGTNGTLEIFEPESTDCDRSGRATIKQSGRIIDSFLVGFQGSFAKRNGATFPQTSHTQSSRDFPTLIVNSSIHVSKPDW